MQTKQSFATKTTYWLKVASLGLVLGLGLQFAQAWVAPATAPPGGNVAGPVTVGDNAQYKTGKLGVNSNIAPIGAFEVGNGGDALIGGKVYSASTVAADSGNTLTTKDYVDTISTTKSEFGVFPNPKKDGLPLAIFGGNGWSTWNQWCRENGYQKSISVEIGPVASPCAGNSNTIPTPGVGKFISWKTDWNCNAGTVSELTCIK